MLIASLRKVFMLRTSGKRRSNNGKHMTQEKIEKKGNGTSDSIRLVFISHSWWGLGMIHIWRPWKLPNFEDTPHQYRLQSNFKKSKTSFSPCSYSEKMRWGQGRAEASPSTFSWLYFLCVRLSKNITKCFFLNKVFSEAVVRRCSVKKVFLEISQNSQENTCARVSFLIKLQDTFF